VVKLRQAELRPVAFKFQARVDSETPSFAAMTLVAPEVRFNALAIFVTPDFALAIVFIVLTSSFVHARRTTFFAFAIPAPNLADHAVLQDGLSWQAMDKHCYDNVIATKAACCRYSRSAIVVYFLAHHQSGLSGC
jgi:hypothetical protein